MRDSHALNQRLRALIPGLLLLSAAGAAGQELTPRAYWPAPRGTEILVFGYNYSTGDIVTDPSLPVVGVDSRIHLGLLAYVGYFSLGGRTANLAIEIPYSHGTTKGELLGEAARADFSGFGDATVSLAVNFLGAPAMTPPDFQKLREKPRPILGGSVKLVLPTGDYDPDKLINIGTNRWAVKGELGYINPLSRKWLFELELGFWYIWDNDDFLGVNRQQDPIGTTELHLVRRFSPGFWASFDVTYYTGGRTTVDGNLRADLQRNWRVGATIVKPFKGKNAVKLGYSTGVVTESGGDYDMLLVSYSRIFK